MKMRLKKYNHLTLHQIAIIERMIKDKKPKAEINQEIYLMEIGAD